MTDATQQKGLASELVLSRAAVQKQISLLTHFWFILMITELQIVGAPAPMTQNFSKWRVTVKVYAPGWRVIKIKNLPTNFDQPVPLSLTTPLRSLQMEYRKQHQTTASLRVQNIADSGRRTSAALPSIAASD